MIATMNANLQRAQLENVNLQRSLDAARANIKRERERNVAQLFPEALSGGTMIPSTKHGGSQRHSE